MSENVNGKVSEKAKTVWIALRVFEACILITVGILAIVYSNNEKFQQWILVILGVFLIMDGIIRVTRFYLEPTEATAIGEGLISSVFELALGVLLIVERNDIVDLLKTLIVYFTAILLFSASIIFIIGPTISIVQKTRKMWIAIVEYVIALIMIVGGVLMLVYKEQATDVITRAVIIICGLFLTALGLYSLVSAFIPFKDRVKKVKPVKESPSGAAPTDAEFTEKKKEETIVEQKPEENNPQIEKQDDNNPQIEKKDDDTNSSPTDSGDGKDQK
jgi:hypothetical protein